MPTDLIIRNIDLFHKYRHLRLDGFPERERRIIIDGPISEKYFDSELRILWVLKEAVSEKGGDSLIKQVNEDLLERDVPIHLDWYKSWGLMIKVSNAILFNNFRLYENHSRDIKSSLKHIAVINLNKFGGYGKQSAHYGQGVEKCKNLVQSQYELLAPDITILGGTRYYLDHLKNFNIEHKDYYPSKSIFPSFVDDNVTYISAYHPNQKTLKHSIYFDYICNNISH